MSVILIRGDATKMPLRSSSVDAIVTDPPYSLGFLNTAWDSFPLDKHGKRRAFANGSKSAAPEGTPFQHWCQEWATEALRVLKPGGHLIAFGATRAYHRLACGIEDAGFEIRDSGLGAWTYSSGLPKSHDVSKAIDREAGAKRDKIRISAAQVRNPKASGGGKDGTENAGRPFIEEAQERGFHEIDSDEPATEEAARWQGYGTALKPAIEPFVIARKPMKGTVAQQMQETGTGGINIQACRIPADEAHMKNCASVIGAPSISTKNVYGSYSAPRGNGYDEGGRWPANLVMIGQLLGSESKFFDASPCFPLLHCPKPAKAERMSYGSTEDEILVEVTTWDKEVHKATLLVDTVQFPPRVIDVSGTDNSIGFEWSMLSCMSGLLALFQPKCKFTISTETSSTTVSKTLNWLARSLTRDITADANCVKASGGSLADAAERGIRQITITSAGTESILGAGHAQSAMQLRISGRAKPGTAHPTVKPVRLMRWLLRLVVPRGGIVLDPFCGSGTTGVAAAAEGFDAVLIDRDDAARYLDIARARLVGADSIDGEGAAVFEQPRIPGLDGPEVERERERESRKRPGSP